MSQPAATIPPAWTTGDRLRKARETAGIASIDMAERLGVSRNTITNYEHDNTRPSLLAIRAYAAETGVPASWLIDGDYIPPTQGDRHSACDGDATIIKFPSILQVAA